MTQPKPPEAQKVYENPLSVTVVLLPVVDTHSRPGEALLLGLLGVQRNIEPKKGLWAMPGGFVERYQTLESAGVREVEEELNLNIEHVQLYKSSATPDGMRNLVFAIGPALNAKQVETFIERFEPNEETQAVKVLNQDTPEQEWAFPLHRQAALEWLSTKGLVWNEHQSPVQDVVYVVAPKKMKP